MKHVIFIGIWIVSIVLLKYAQNNQVSLGTLDAAFNIIELYFAWVMFSIFLFVIYFFVTTK